VRSEARVFLNHRGQPLTRFGIRYILARCLDLPGSPEPPQEAASPAQYEAQHSCRPAEVRGRPVDNQPVSGSCQPDHDVMTNDDDEREDDDIGDGPGGRNSPVYVIVSAPFSIPTEAIQRLRRSLGNFGRTL